MPPVLVSATFGVASAILAESALSFLGIGVPPPQPSWGGLLALSGVVRGPGVVACGIPGLAIFGAVAAYNLVGESVAPAPRGPAELDCPRDRSGGTGRQPASAAARRRESRSIRARSTRSRARAPGHHREGARPATGPILAVLVNTEKQPLFSVEGARRSSARTSRDGKRRAGRSARVLGTPRRVRAERRRA